MKHHGAMDTRYHRLVGKQLDFSMFDGGVSSVAALAIKAAAIVPFNWASRSDSFTKVSKVPKVDGPN